MPTLRRATTPSPIVEDEVTNAPTDVLETTECTGATATDFAVRAVPGRRRRRIAAGSLAAAACAALVVGLSLHGGDDTTTAVTTPSQVAARSDVIGTSRSSQRPALAVGTATPTPSATPSATASATPSRTATPTPSARATRTPSSVATPTATRTPSATPTVDTTTRGRAIASRWATSTVNVRTAPSADAARFATVAEGTELKATDRRVDGWRQVVVDGRTGWVSTEYLTTDEPSPTATKSASSPAKASNRTATSRTSTSTASTGTSAGTCPSYAVESGMVPAAVHVHRVLCANFPAITSYGGYRAGDQEHGTGHALDAMTSGDAGWALANWARAHASELGISQVIYAQHIWTTQRSGEGWRSMSDRGGVTANHYDHVHITVS